MIRRQFFAVLAAMLLASPLAQAQERPLQVVASFSILADLVREVGGDAVAVSALVGPDGDAHVFEPSPADATRIARADLVIVNGLKFEGWMTRLVKSAGYRGPLVVASKGVKAREMAEAGHDHGHGHAHDNIDPHAWQNIANGILYVENIRAALVAARPAQAAAINARAAAYTTTLRQLDSEVRATFASLPKNKRRVITSHDAFGYFGAAYGIELIAPQGRSTDSEASAADVAALIRQIKARQARAVFVENISNPRLVERIASEGGGVVGGRLYSDALSAPGGVADSYVKMFRHNTAELSKAMSAE